MRPEKTFDLFTVIAVLFVIGLTVACGVALVDLREAQWREASRSTRNVVGTLEADIARNINLFDLSLEAVQIGIRSPTFDRLDEETRRLVLFDRSSTAAYLGSIRVLNREGHAIMDSRELVAGNEYLGDRDFFTVHEKKDVGLFVSTLHVDKYGQYVVVVSRRLKGVDGKFDGVVVGTLRLAYFKMLLANLSLSPKSAFSIVHQDGTMLVRYPFDRTSTGMNLMPSPAFQQMIGERQAEFRTKGPSDDAERFIVSKQVADLPLYISANLASDDVEAGWRRPALFIISLMALLSSSSIASMLFLKRKFRRRAEAKMPLTRIPDADALKNSLKSEALEQAHASAPEGVGAQRTKLSILPIN